MFGRCHQFAWLAATALLLSASVAASEIQITVGPQGEASTIYEAMSKARSKRLTNDTVRILVSGTQYLSSPIFLGSTDSRLTIQGADKGATISGGRILTGWKKGAGAIWEVEIPMVKSGAMSFRQLFVNGERRQRARTPNSGYFRMDGHSIQGNPATFKYRAGDLKKEWAKDGDVEVIGYINWQDFRMSLQSIDESTRTATLVSGGKVAGGEENARYFIENAPDALDEPGEWQLNSKTGVLRYWPMPGEDFAKAQVIVPMLANLLVVSGDPSAKKAAENITLRNITFAHTEYPLGAAGYLDTQSADAISAAIQFIFAKNCLVEDCTFAHLGTYGVQLAIGVQGTKIRYCEFFDLGAGGVKIGDGSIRSAAFERNYGNEISDSHIHSIGRFFAPAAGILIMHSANNRISHNHIHDTYNTGIAVGWTWGYYPNPSRNNIIEYNHIHDIGQGVLSDMGGIYTLGIQPGTIVQNNLIHDVNCNLYGGNGLYTDEGSSEILLQNNIVYRCKSACFHQNFGRNNIIRNNIFAFGEEFQINRTREDEFHGLDFLNNIIYFDSGSLQAGNWWNDKYTFDRNVYFDARPNVPPKFEHLSLQGWQARGHDKNSIIADPLFVDAKHYDFRLRPESPALKLGFRPIDISTVGPRPRR